MAANLVSIVMYHYVRDLQRSRFPAIKGRSLQEFKFQIEHIKKHYHPISMEDLIGAVETGDSLPPNAALLTFDDGYADHYTTVFPILDEAGIQGSFFPPVMTVVHGRILDVNKIHFILASVSDSKQISAEIFKILDELRPQYGLKASEVLYKELAVADRFDTADVVFIKRLLQKALPENLRALIADRLFKKFVSADESGFAAELYLSTDQIKCMKRHGMAFGSHGHDHYWLDSLEPQAQEREIDLSLEFLKGVGCELNQWVMCYPYGAWNESLLEILKRRHCKIGLTTRVAVADLATDNPLLLPRLDTNDLPAR